MAVALIVAAGRGERLGASLPKALVEVGGRSLLSWCVSALSRVTQITAIVAALPADRLDAAPAGVIAVAGGASRSASVSAALAAAPPDDVIVVHDAARVLAEPGLFADVIELLVSSGADAALAAAPVTDTIKEVAGVDGVSGAAGVRREVVRTVDRSRLWAVQTPQVFRREALQRALAVDADVLAAATDDAWLIERQGGRVVLAPGPAENIKITTPLDLHVAELLLAERVKAGELR